MASIPLEAIEPTTKNDILPPTEHLADNGDSSKSDALTLARLGKRQVLRRNFGPLAILAFSCTVLATWEGLIDSSSTTLLNGGPSGFFWAYIIVWIGTLSTFFTICELASIAPIASGQYHWVAMLAPRWSRRFLSYFTGWITMLGWQTTISSSAYLAGSIIQGLLVLNYPDSTFYNWQGTLIGYAIIILAVFVNTVSGKYLPNIESASLVFHILGFFAIMIVLAYMAPHSSADEVFNNWLNGGGWPTQGLSSMVGFIGIVFSFTGADGAVHMAEEIHKADTVIPQTIIASIILNGLMGFAITLAMLFGLGDLNEILSSPTGYPFLSIFYQATNSVPGVNAMVAVLLFAGNFGTFGFIASSSRMVWSFARDRALPFSSFLSRVNPSVQIPLNAVAVTTICGSLLLAINFGSSAALNIILSMNVFCFYFTYFISCALLLWRRCQKDSFIARANPTFEDYGNRHHSDNVLIWGPWHLKGAFGICNYALACAYTLVVMFFGFWPAAVQPELISMNWSCVIVGGIILFSIVYYLVWGRHHYHGPFIETQEAERALI